MKFQVVFFLVSLAISETFVRCRADPLPALVLHSSGNFLIDYFTRLYQITQIGIFSCDDKDNNVRDTVLPANNHHLRWSTKFAYENVADTVKGFYLNLSCPGTVDALNHASEQDLFGKGYHWLIEGAIGQTPHDALENLKGIRADSQISFIQSFGDEKLLNDVYAYANHLSYDIIAQPYGTWSAMKGFNLTYVPKPKHRNNFNQTEFRLMIFMMNTEQQIFSETQMDVSYFDNLYGRFGVTFDTLLQVKFFHSLNQLLREKFNFKATVSVISKDVEQYDRLNGADIISAGAFLRANNFDRYDFIFTKFKLEQGLFYLLTPELTSDRDYLTFLIPLDTPVWVVFILFLLLLAVLVKIFGMISKSNDIDVITQIVGIVTNQGVNPMPENYSLRVIFLTGLTMMLVLFNLYTASLIGVILTPPSDRFENSTQVLKSSIALARQDNYYTKEALGVSNENRNVIIIFKC